MTKKGITIGLLITFLISLTASELYAWHMIRRGDQSTVILSKSCQLMQDNNGDSTWRIFHAVDDETGNVRLILKKFCTFAEPQQQLPYRSLLTPTPFHYTCYTLQRDDVCIVDIWCPPRG